MRLTRVINHSSIKHIANGNPSFIEQKLLTICTRDSKHYLNTVLTMRGPTTVSRNRAIVVEDTRQSYVMRRAASLFHNGDVIALSDCSRPPVIPSALCTVFCTYLHMNVIRLHPNAMLNFLLFI